MLNVDPRIVSFLRTVTGRYQAGAASAHVTTQPVVTKFKQLALKLSPYVGSLTSTLDGTATDQVSLDTQMGDYRQLVFTLELSAIDSRLGDLSTILEYYAVRIATILSKEAISDSEVVDYLDVVKWGDMLVNA
jgi:hypothetical protein